MFATMYEVRKDSDLDKFLVCPLGTDPQNDYAIVCRTEYDAKSLCAQIAMQMIPSPVEAPHKYKRLGIHPNGRTELYCLKGQINAVAVDLAVAFALAEKTSSRDNIFK